MGDNLYWMITITDRNQSQKFLSFYKTYGIEVVLSTLGKGTAASEILNDFGLEATQKAVLLSVVTGKVWNAVQKGLQTIMLIDIPGTGMEGAEKFLGVSLASEKELVLIVVKHADKNNVMTAIMQEAGLETKAKAIVFSLPVTGTAGLRLQDLNEENT